MARLEIGTYADGRKTRPHFIFLRLKGVEFAVLTADLNRQDAVRFYEYYRLNLVQNLSNLGFNEKIEFAYSVEKLQAWLKEQSEANDGAD